MAKINLDDLSIEELKELLSKVETKFFADVYGLKKGIFTDEITPENFSETERSYLTVKNFLSEGQYVISFRAPEQSTMKMDLVKISPDPSPKVRQARVLVAKRDWKRLIGI